MNKNSYTGHTYKTYIDMVKQIHLLICGTTGSGKSTLEHALIYTAILMDPKSKFIYLDSKGIELFQYSKLKNCIAYADTLETIVRALKIAENIMLNRFKDMRKKGIKKSDKPPIYICIDEYADIAISPYKKDCLKIIQRISNMARATNIHIWLCTLTPVKQVLDTPIKVCFDSRIGLRCRSEQDSRNVIGFKGLETLPRYGSGYYLTPERSGIIELPLIQEHEIDKMIQWLKE